MDDSLRLGVYTKLLAPESHQLWDIRKLDQTLHVFALKVCISKRMRSVDLPEVLFPTVLFQFLYFHKTYIRTALHKRLKIEEGDARCRFLFHHTEIFDPSESPDVTRTTCTLLTRQGPKL